MNVCVTVPDVSDDITDLCVLLRSVRGEPGISAETSAPSLTAQISRGSATSGSRITEVRVNGSFGLCVSET